MATIGVFGAGSWGAALSMVLYGKGHTVFLWSNDPAEADKIRKTRRLMHKLPEISIPDGIRVTNDHREFMDQAEILLVAVPSKYLRSFAESFAGEIRGQSKLVVSATKGLESGSLSTMGEVLESLWCNDASRSVEGVVALSGPSHAEEVARELPTAIVSAHASKNPAKTVQEIFQTPRFRVYTNGDRKGVEIGAALKNIIAIAVGISDGLGFGDNARAALISRGLYELSLAGSAMGAQSETFAGLSALGDLVVTCTSRHSRNRKFGELIAKGYRAEDAEEEVGMVVEGITTVKVIPDIQKKYGLELPISEEVYNIVYEDADPSEAVERLMLRDLKPEIAHPARQGD
ncbi:MAG: NAD(P)-dependent glycerol-3-phosphate dehydrogenase [Candidatus Omnitrophota bacterium]|jgi:glycerol-3-phosphate dehydrogenase (NAD(P)+)|nr:MAG: NAD(P)-dependent glycerol-3-phosphate dehydrogenase [Candidatus Omnitrophota bacterium]